MDQQKVLNIEVRSKTGKGISKQLRRQGLIPGIVYGKGMESVPVTLNPKELIAALAEAGNNTLLALKGGGSLDGSVAIITDAFVDSLRGTIGHVDLHRINLSEKVRVEVKLHMAGTAAGVKEGGLLDITAHTIEVECLPSDIPEHIDVDITNLGIGQSIHVGELQIPASLKVLTDSRASVVSVLGKAKEEAPAAEA
jgi:large subunit ribosomal protein L25